MSTLLPILGFFPALRLAAEVRLGDWVVGPMPSSVKWRTPRFQELAEKLLASFAPAGFEHAAVLMHGSDGFDGVCPSPEEIAAIEAALRFAALDANDDIIGTWNVGHQFATAENAAFYVQPIDEEHGRVVHQRGGALRRELSMGWTIGEQPLPLPDAVLPLMQPVQVSSTLASAVFDAFLAGAQASSGRVKIALEWHAAAMANPRAVTPQQRIVSIKTGFEALLGTSKSREAATALRVLFEGVTQPHRKLLPWPGLLWAPNERLLPRGLRAKGKLQPDPRTELEDWFMCITEARNNVIHDGVLEPTEYKPPKERPLTRYKGSLFHIGERVLREAIKASLGAHVLLEGALLDQAEWDRVVEVVRQFRVDDGVGAAKATRGAPRAASGEAAPQRSLDDLLAELGARAANEVELTKARGAVASRMDGFWVEAVQGREMLVSSGERETLEAAGAERPLPSHFRRC